MARVPCVLASRQAGVHVQVAEERPAQGIVLRARLALLGAGKRRLRRRRRKRNGERRQQGEPGQGGAHSFIYIGRCTGLPRARWPASRLRNGGSQAKQNG
jgi:hypothetical protein